MATKEIKQRIRLDGENEYNRAIKEAQRNLRTLKTELKAETAELGKNATEQQKAETRAKSLRQQIAEQEKVVKTLKAALDEAKQEYGDNADVVQSWEQKLNNARATLAGMKNDLDGLGQGMQKTGNDAAMATVAAKSLADSFGKIAEAGNSISGAIESIFTGMVSTVRTAITEVWEEMVELAGRANSWVDLAGFWNTDAATIQKWTHAVEGAHDSFEDLNNAVTRINMGDQKKIAAATGVSGENYTDKWQYAMAVMDAMARMDYEQKLAAAGEVFGEKRATKVMDLLNDWATISENLSKFDVENGGIGMSEEQIQDMSTLAEKVDLIKTTWQAFIDSFMAEHLAKLGLDLTGNAQTILEDLIKFVETGDDADLAKLEQDITDFFDRIVAAIKAAAEKLGEAGAQLEESDNGIVRAIGKALTGISDALEWLADENNIQQVIHGFELLAGFWVAGKGLALVSTIAQLAANFKIIGGAGALTGLLGGGGGAVATGGGLGSVLAGAGYLAVGLVMVAPMVQKLFDPKTWEKSEYDQKLDEVGEKIGGQAVDEMNKEAGITNQGLLRTLWNRATYTGGDTSGLAVPEGTTKKDEEIYEGPEGVTIPRAGARKLDATVEQMSAAEAFWDAWKLYASGNGSDEGFDRAWTNFENSFGENEAVFNRLNDMMDRLMQQLDSNGEHLTDDRWRDLPAEWWLNAGANQQNGVTSEDLAGFRNLPAQMQRAAQAGTAAGVSGIRVNLDGRAVGELVAPYVSRAIARDLIM